MSDDHRPEPASELDFVPTLAFQAIDFVEKGTDLDLTMWQKRLLIQTYGPGEAAAARRKEGTDG